jgi:Zn-dependent peptidase ImmA (M78 family)
MKFKINNVEWEIKEISQKEIKQIQNKKFANNEENIEDTAHRYYGITYNDDCIIYLDKDIKQDRKRKTLYHELTHCYISSYITHQDKNYDEEMVADIVSNSYDIITEISNKYFSEVKDE